MKPEVIVQVAIGLLELAFFAGGLYYAIRQMRRDLNGLGVKVRAMQQVEDERFLVVVVSLLLLSPEKDRKFLASKLLEAGRGKP